ncbi:MAG: hypothetical protein K6G76_05440 [Lachnospiraceae bacterium]|nr:hypothetical protein [Lachnospiraceae bacterium]
MSGYGKISKATGKLYLAMIVAAFICMLINTVFVCADMSGVKIGESIESKITTEISEMKAEGNIYVLPDIGLDMSSTIDDKVNPGMGFMVTIAGIILLMFIRQLCFADVRTKEFELTLPVKKTTLVMHEYWFFFLLITGITMLQGIIFAIYQTHYNNVWTRVAGVNASTDFNGVPLDRLFAYVGMYVLSLLVVFTWVFLCMTVSKNALVGGALALFSWLGLVSFDYNIGFSSLLMNIFSRCPVGYEQDPYGRYIATNIDEVVRWEQKRHYLTNVFDAILHAEQRFEYLGEVTNKSLGYSGSLFYGGNDFDMKNIPFSMFVAIIVSTLVIGIILIWIAAKKRELTKGGRFAYFKIAEWLFAILCGLMWYEALADRLSYRYNDYYEIIDLTVFISAIAVTVIIIYLLNPIRFKKNETGSYITKRSFFSKLSNFQRVLIASVIGILSAFMYLKEMVESICFTIDEYDKFVGEWTKESFQFEVDTFKHRIVIALITLIIVSKGYGYWIEKKRNTREFFEILPESRIRRKVISIVKDLLIVIIPIVFSAISIIHVYLPTVDVNTPGYDYNECATYVRTTLMIAFLYVFMLIGLLHFVEEMFTNGAIRPVAFLGVILMITYSVEGALGTFKNTYIDDDISNLFSANFSVYYYNGKFITCAVLFYVIIGATLLVLSVMLANKKELSRNGFCFDFSRYLFAFLIAGTAFMMSQPYVVALWHRIIILISCIVVFLLLVYFMTPKEQRVEFDSL